MFNLAKFGVIAAMGGLVGFILGVFAAPKSGAESRQELLDKSEQLYNQTSATIDETKAKTAEVLSILQSKGQDLLVKASDQVRTKLSES